MLCPFHRLQEAFSYLSQEFLLMYRGKDPQKSRAPMSFIELYHYGLISHRLSTNSTSKCCIVEKKEITSFEFQSQVSQLGGTTDVWQNIRCSSRRVSFFSSNFSRAVLVLRGHAPFGQHQESRSLARSNDITVLNGFVNTID